MGIARPMIECPPKGGNSRGQHAVSWGASRRRRHISWLATQPAIGIGQRLVIQDAVEWLVFEAFVERMLVLSLRPGRA